MQLKNGFFFLIGHICIKVEDHKINESKTIYKPFDMINLYSFYDIIFIFYLIIQC
jgi:hypothetical protein